MCEAIYIGNTQHIFKKMIDSRFSDLLRLLKIRQKSDSFAAHFEQHFKTTMPRIDLRKCMTFRVINQTWSVQSKYSQNLIAIYVWRNV